MKPVNEITALSRGAVPDDGGLFDRLTEVFDAYDRRERRAIFALRVLQIISFAVAFLALI